MVFLHLKNEIIQQLFPAQVAFLPHFLSVLNSEHRETIVGSESENLLQQHPGQRGCGHAVSWDVPSTVEISINGMLRGHNLTLILLISFAFFLLKFVLHNLAHKFVLKILKLNKISSEMLV